MGNNLPCCIDQLIWVMSEIQADMSLNLYQFNSSWVYDEGGKGEVFYR
jgi:hypothetical protein